MSARVGEMFGWMESGIWVINVCGLGGPKMKDAKDDIDGLPWDLEEAELVLIKRALRQTNGNVSKAAELLGVHRMKIYRRLAKKEKTDIHSSG